MGLKGLAVTLHASASAYKSAEPELFKTFRMLSCSRAIVMVENAISFPERSPRS
jgi:hypothetical protein